MKTTDQLINGQASEKELLEARAYCKSQMLDIQRAAEKEGRDVNDEEWARWEKFNSDFDQLTEKRERLLKMRKFSAQDESSKTPVEQPKDLQKSLKEKYNNAFSKYLRYGLTRLTAEEQDILHGNFANLTEAQRVQTTGLISGSDAAGGYTIPEEFSNILEAQMKYYGGMLEAAQILRTNNGRVIPWPTNNDTGNVGEWLDSEASPTNITETALVFGEKRLEAWNVHSDLVYVHRNLLQDTAFDLEAYMAEILAERLGRTINAGLTTGDGSNKPNGLETALTAASRWVNGSDDATISFPDLIDVKHAVDRSYRTGPNVGYMFNDTTLAALKKLSIGSSDARSLWQPSYREGEPDTIDGTRYWVNNDMDDIGSGKYPVFFGDFSKYIYRIVNGTTLIRFDERFMEKLHFGYLAYMRVDGECIQPAAFSMLRNITT
jgi:HK97 family phage major capsid protein